jgi:hypothetical protein
MADDESGGGDRGRVGFSRWRVTVTFSRRSSAKLVADNWTAFVLLSRLWIWHAKLTADASGREFHDLPVPRNRSPPTIRRILPDRVFAAFSNKATSMARQVFEQVATLHAEASCGTSIT